MKKSFIFLLSLVMIASVSKAAGGASESAPKKTDYNPYVLPCLQIFGRIEEKMKRFPKEFSFDQLARTKTAVESHPQDKSLEELEKNSVDQIKSAVEGLDKGLDNFIDHDIPLNPGTELSEDPRRYIEKTFLATPVETATAVAVGGCGVTLLKSNRSNFASIVSFFAGGFGLAYIYNVHRCSVQKPVIKEQINRSMQEVVNTAQHLHTQHSLREEAEKIRKEMADERAANQADHAETRKQIAAKAEDDRAANEAAHTETREFFGTQLSASDETNQRRAEESRQQLATLYETQHRQAAESALRDRKIAKKLEETQGELKKTQSQLEALRKNMNDNHQQSQEQGDRVEGELRDIKFGVYSTASMISVGFQALGADSGRSKVCLKIKKPSSPGRVLSLESEEQVEARRLRSNSPVGLQDSRSRSSSPVRGQNQQGSLQELPFKPNGLPIVVGQGFFGNLAEK